MDTISECLGFEDCTMYNTYLLKIMKSPGKSEKKSVSAKLKEKYSLMRGKGEPQILHKLNFSQK